MSKVFVIFFIIFFAYFIEAQAPQCGPNEIYKRPHGYEPNCATDAPRVINPNCICKRGYARNGIQECIPASKCPKCSDPNEFYTYCINPCPPGAYCFAPCIPGCICKPGYTKSKEGKCVKKSLCKGPNEIYTDCINPCPPGAYCFAACIPGCVCIDGYERNDKGVCVEKIVPNIPKCSGPNEIYTGCTNTEKNICTNYCVSGCECSAGFVRDANDACVEKDKCVVPTDDIIKFNHQCRQVCDSNGKCYEVCELAPPPPKNVE